MTLLHCFRNVLLASFPVLVGLMASARLDAQEGAESAYSNLKKLSIASNSQNVLPTFRIDGKIPLRAGVIGHPARLAERPPALSPALAMRRWSAEDLPFFCRIEHNLGLKTQVPIKFRLGSVEYVDWLEGKGQY